MMTTTSAPELIYLFVVLLAPAPGGTPYEEIYRTTDTAACEAQAKDWSAKLAPTKFVCLPHRQKKLKSYGAAEADAD